MAYIGEGSSVRPVCVKEKILVSLSKEIIPQDTEDKNALKFVRYNIIYFWPIKYIGFN